MSTIHKQLLAFSNYPAVIKDHPLPTATTDFLGQMILLNHIPFHYLVPDERMLPVESIRFFSLDPNWMNALMDGAFSIGRAAELDQNQDKETWPDVYQQAMDYAYNMRKKQLGQKTSKTANLKNISGFLLRSQVVIDYPNMEAHAYADAAGTSSLNTLRLSHLSKSLLLGLFDGNFQQLVLQQPTEGIHFGFDLNEKGDYNKTLRFLKDTTVKANTPPNTTGKPITYPAGSLNGQTITNASYRQGFRNTIPVARLAQQISTKLSATTFTSAEYALEMVQSAGEVIIKNK